MAKRPSKSAIPTDRPTADHRVVVLLGPDLFLRQEWSAAVRAQLEQVHGECDTFRFDGESVNAAEVLDECRSFGLMSGHKLIFLDAAEKLLKADERPLFERYAANPSEGATLVLRCDAWMPGEKKLQAAIREGGGVFVGCQEVEEDQALSWCGRRAKSHHNTTIVREAAEMLIARHGSKLAKLDSELAKLALAAGEGGITPDLVVQLGAGSRQDVNPFTATSELLSGDVERAIHQIRAVLDTQPRDGHVPAIYSAVSQAMRLHAAAAADPRRASKMHWSPAQEQARVAKMARACGRRGAAGLLEASLRLDANSKSGVGDPERGLECLAVRFTLAGRGIEIQGG